MTNRCTAVKHNGEPCTLPASSESGLCWAHDPANREKRRRGQSRGGRNKPSREIQDLKRRISEVIDTVLDGSQDRSRAAVAIQGFNALRAVLEQERRQVELDDVLTRLDALEEQHRQSQPMKGARRW